MRNFSVFLDFSNGFLDKMLPSSLYVNRVHRVPVHVLLIFLRFYFFTVRMGRHLDRRSPRKPANPTGSHPYRRRFSCHIARHSPRQKLPAYFAFRLYDITYLSENLLLLTI